MPDREPEVVVTRSLRSPATGLGRPSVRTTFQLAARVLPRDNQQEVSVYQDAVRGALRWLRGKCPGDLPEEAWRGESFECGVPGHSIEAISIPEDKIWSVRLVHPDAPFAGREAVPGRTWTTEVAFRRQDEGVQFGIRVLCASQAYSTQDIALTRPRLVLNLAKHFILKEVRPIEPHPIRLRVESELDVLYGLLTNPARTMPVMLLTEADPRNLDVHVQVSPYVLDPDNLARKVEGLAYVVTIPRNLTFPWTNRVGKAWSAFLGAVRTYQPGLDFDEDSPTEHPLALLKNILFFRHKGLEAEAAFAAFLVDQVYQYGATKRVDWNGCLFLADARMYRAKKAREASRDERELLELYEKEITALQQKIEELQQEAEGFNNDAMQSERDRDIYIEENQRLRHRIDALQAALEAKTGESVDASLPIPDNYDELPEWVITNLAGRLVLHPRALRGLNEAEYEDVEHVYRALLLLANEYRNMRQGHDGAKEAFDKTVSELGLKHGPSITKGRAGEEGGAYYVPYPLGTQRQQFLERHLRNKGNTRDPKRCLRIYFFWDADRPQVVVGWLPGHLPIRST